MHTGEALYTCPNCPMTFASSANMYKHRQRLHKAEYAACKQQCFPPNIIKQAKSGAFNKKHSEQEGYSGRSNRKCNENIVSLVTDCELSAELQVKSSLINLQALSATEFGIQ